MANYVLLRHIWSVQCNYCCQICLVGNDEGSLLNSILFCWWVKFIILKTNVPDIKFEYCEQCELKNNSKLQYQKRHLVKQKLYTFMIFQYDNNDVNEYRYLGWKNQKINVCIYIVDFCYCCAYIKTKLRYHTSQTS